MSRLHPPTPPTTNKHDDEVHPAYALISASRISTTPGAVLFDSDTRHSHLMRVTVQRASRSRDLRADWIHGTGPSLIEVDMSEAQWAAFVSSPNTSGVPCTVRYTEKDGPMPGLEYLPRLALSMAEVRDAAQEAFAKVKQARDALAALKARKEPKPKAAEIREAERRLHYAIENAADGVDFATRMLTEHTEKVVTRARADIESIAAQKAMQMGLTQEQAAGLVALSVEVPEAIEGSVQDPV